MKGTLIPKHKGRIYVKQEPDVELTFNNTSASGDDIHRQ